MKKKKFLLPANRFHPKISYFINKKKGLGKIPGKMNKSYIIALSYAGKDENGIYRRLKQIFCHKTKQKKKSLIKVRKKYSFFFLIFLSCSENLLQAYKMN